MMSPTRDLARGRWPQILTAFGLAPRYLRNQHSDCPLCAEGKDRYRFDDKDGEGTYYCSQCGPGDGFRLACGITGLSFKEVAARIDQMFAGHQPRPQVPESDDAAKKAKARSYLRSVFVGLQQIGDLDPVARYLRSRGLKPGARDLYYHPSLAYYEPGQPARHLPAMVALMRQPGGEGESLHATYLTADGHKADVPCQRKVLTKIEGLAGCAIRLSEVAPHIGIAEGIETALSVTALYGIPCWACYSSSVLASFVPPEGVEEITIFADADSHFAGQAAATQAAARLAKAKYQVRLAPFLAAGTDYNDVLKERA